MISFRGQEKLGPRPDRSPLGVLFKISDKRPHPFHMWSPPPPRDMSCPSHMLLNCDSKEKQETACSLAPAGHPNKNDSN